MFSQSLRMFVALSAMASLSAPVLSRPIHVFPRIVARDDTDCPAAITVTVTAGAVQTAAAATTVAAAAAASSTASASSIGSFGSCTVPQIKFAVGFDNRKETSFEPVDQVSYNHGSADNIDIITQFMCDTLVNKCGADQTAKDTCASAKTAADTVTAKTGGQADAFNAIFGIKTDFAAVQEVDDQGRVVAGTGSAAATSVAVNDAAAATTTAAAAAATTTAAAATTASSGSSSIGNFGSCTVPQIKFAVGFDNRKETSFEPVDQVSYDHGSADNIDIITQFMCDTLVNKCGADQTAKDTCASAKTAADTVTAKTGGQADAFNAVFGIKTDFAAVTEVDDQGRVVSGAGSGTAASDAAATTAAAAATTAAAAAATTAAAASSGSASSSSSSSIGKFGSCTVPQIKFGTGFDGRKETAFEPVDQVSYNHGSADNIAVITGFMCNTLTNTCGADQTAKNTCATATAAASAAKALTGAQADAFNAVFGIKTDFAAVQQIDNTGKAVSS